MNELNLISDQELHREIGRVGIGQLLELGQWLDLGNHQITDWQSHFNSIVRPPAQSHLTLGQQFSLPARLAPSLVCKSEVELFGRSMPRFAIRLRFSGRDGFLNLRRLGTLAGQLHGDPLVCREIINLVLSAACIADGFLVIPQRYDGWHTLTAPLAKACCEQDHSDPDLELIPYVRHMKPGGGMCAQAVCFMAAALNRKMDAPVHGIPEITYIATERDDAPPQGISFDGLLTDEMAAYFNSSRNKRLGASWEFSKIPWGKIHQDVLAEHDTGLVQDFGDALTSYLLSGVPVILPVDVGRMQGVSATDLLCYTQATISGNKVRSNLRDPLGARPSIFTKNGLETTITSPGEWGSLSHVVLAVGCTKPEKYEDPFSTEHRHSPRQRSETVFCFNDSAHFPFMRASAHDLVLAACYTDNPTNDTLLLGWLMPVRPKAVKMPLLDEAVGSRAGIKAVSALLKEISFDLTPEIPVKQRLTLVGGKSEFRLVAYDKKEILRHLQDILSFTSEETFKAYYQPLLDQIPTGDSEQWSWVEVDGTSVFLWDAQHSINKSVFKLDLMQTRAEAGNYPVASLRRAAGKLAKRLLFGAAIQTRQGMKWYGRGLRSTQIKKRSSIKLQGTIEASLLTSFEAIGDWSTVAIGDGTEAIELYMLMQNCADQWVTSWRARTAARLRSFLGRMGNPAIKEGIAPLLRCCALELMARECDNESIIRQVALKILENKRRIVSVATYLPSLCAGTIGPNPNKPNAALRATKFVLKVVKLLRQLDPIRAPRVVELVGGSRMLGRIDLSENTKRHFVRCIDESDALQNILACVKQLLPDVVAAKTRLAFEFEPSCLVALGSLKTIQRFCEQLASRSRDDKNWDRIGLNLDIPHYALIAGHRPNELPSVVRERVFHAHISFHTSGHLADGILEDEDVRKASCLEWLLLLEELKRRGTFPGLLSLEIECAKTRNQVQQSFEMLKGWLSLTA